MPVATPGFRDRPCRHDNRIGGKPKKRFETEAEALDHLNNAPGMGAYLCPHCSYYHVGHAPGPTARDPIKQRLKLASREVDRRRRRA